MTITRRSLVIWLCLGAGLILLWLAWRWIDNFPWRADFSREPAPRVFQKVMGHPVPKGVSGLRIAGRHYFIKKWVWMRFRATDGAIKSLTHEANLLDKALAQLRVERTRWSGDSKWNKYDDADRELVGWNEIGPLNRVEIYEIGAKSRDWLWDGVMIVDRKRHLVYLYAHSD